MNEEIPDEQIELTPEEIVIKKSRARQMALAAIMRGKDARIPESYLRLNEDIFYSLLDPIFYGGKDNTKQFAHDVYHTPEILLDRKFISIDGGDYESRLMAGYAILFRMIAYDRVGMYCDCRDTMHKFQSLGKSSEGLTRNDLADELKNYDVFMVGEFERSEFKPYFESAEFFDEVLGYRVNYSKPTIVTCKRAISTGSIAEDAAAGKAVNDAGEYLSRLMRITATTKNVLRIRVKVLR